MRAAIEAIQAGHVATPSTEFRSRLQTALGRTEPAARIDALAELAREPRSFVETIQLDRAFARDERAASAPLPVIRLALLSSHTVDHLLPAIRVAGLARRLRLEVYTGAYGQYRQEILDSASRLHAFRPEAVLLSLNAREFGARIPLEASPDEADGALRASIDQLRGLWDEASRHFGAVIIQQGCLDVSEPIFGSYDRLVPGSPSRVVARCNDLLAAAAAEARVLWLDIERASARDGIDAWFDVARWLQGKMEIAPPAAPRYAELLLRLIDAQRGRARKCIVLDLDNTLWGGVVGDVGVAGIVLGEGSARGEAHLALQRYALRLKDRGIILAVCSKNDAGIAEAAFHDHPEMLLRLADISAFIANWDDKAENLRRIAGQLNIGLDSLVFVDDNPAERARVRASLPMVAVPELPDDPALYVRTIADAGYFEAVMYTNEDRLRGAQYAANAEREALRGSAQSMDEFLDGLDMSVTFGTIGPVDLARSTQLLNKTNQFNATGRRYTEDEVAAIAGSDACITRQFRLLDRFGDNGLVSVMLLRPIAGRHDVLEIENWVMSCRVFGRQLEFEAMNIVAEEAARRGIATLEANYVPTDRNGVVRDLYSRLGFSEVAVGADGTSRWRLDMAHYTSTPTHITRSSQP